MNINNLSFCWLPYGDENLASSRLRVYRIHRELIRRGMSSTIGFSSSANVAVIQKRIDSAAFIFAMKAKMRRMLLVYDVDDIENEPNGWLERTRLLVDIADLVIVSTQLIKEYLLDNLGDCGNNEKISVVDNAIDYDIIEPVVKNCRQSGQTRVYWFGNGCNFVSVKNELEIS